MTVSEILNLRKKAEQNIAKNKTLKGQPNNSTSFSEISDQLQAVQFEFDIQNEELKASYRALETERLKLSDLFQLAPVGYLILNSVGLVVDINQTGLDILNLGPAAVVNQRFQNLVQPEDLEAFHHFLYKMHKSGSRQSFDMGLRPVGQAPMILQLQGLVVDNNRRIASEKELMYHITFNDVTKTRMDQQQLIETKERLEMTLKASSAGVWSLDVNKNLFYLDDCCRSMLALNPFEFYHSIEHFATFVAKEDIEKVNNSFRNAVFLDREIDVDFKAHLANGIVKFFSLRGHFVHTVDGNKKIAGVLMDITDKKNLQLSAEKLRVNQQKIILDAILNAQEKERKKVSEALHDSVCQLLYGIKLNVQALNSEVKKSQTYHNLNKLLNQAIQETRNISYDLTPSVLIDFGFKAGIMELVQRLSTPAFRITAEICDKTDELPKDLQLSVFRIVQELLNNSIKHSEASGATISIATTNDMMFINVGDNGKGISAAENMQSGSGLRGIRNRVYLLNGSFNMKTAEGEGVQVTVTFNIQTAISFLKRR